jgi:CDP-diacylglycerol---serine O-phosphatidyltransferase
MSRSQSLTPSAARYVHPSNLLTYLSVAAGLMAIVAAGELRSWSVAGALLAVCALADTMDGRFARLFRRSESQARFGVELDSLADALTFGVVPVVCLYLLLPFPSPAARVLWMVAAVVYVLGALTRLAFFNVHHTETPGFVGLPTTAAGLVWSSAFLLAPPVPVAAALLLACGLAMVSALRVPRPRGLGMAAFLGWGVTLIVLHGARF